MRWNARLQSHLGTFEVEVAGGTWATIRGDGDAMAAMASMIALLAGYLPEREPHPNLFDATLSTLATLAEPAHWPTAYVHWELGLLRVLGYGLTLDRCAATGAEDGLAFVSPKSGCAVSRDAGQPYADRLLPLPEFLLHGGAADRTSWLEAMRLTGYFLERRVAASVNRRLPDSRARLVDRFAKPAA